MTSFDTFLTPSQMAVVNPISIISLMKTLLKNHPNTFKMLYGILSNFHVFIVMFALLYFGAAAFMTVWLRIKAADSTYLNGQGSKDWQIFEMWIGSERVLKKGLTMIFAFTLFAISAVPVMEQVKSL